MRFAHRGRFSRERFGRRTRHCMCCQAAQGPLEIKTGVTCSFSHRFVSEKMPHHLRCTPGTPKLQCPITGKPETDPLTALCMLSFPRFSWQSSASPVIEADSLACVVLTLETNGTEHQRRIVRSREPWRPAISPAKDFRYAFLRGLALCRFRLACDLRSGECELCLADVSSRGRRFRFLDAQSELCRTAGSRHRVFPRQRPAR